jgi:NADP-dependent 3-hydroxy acid dehydrogenase YdfG
MALSDYQTALVTGASSGIGEAVTRALCGRGLTVHAVARRGDRLQRLADEVGCTPLVLDLADTAAIRDALAGLDVDIVVNNAGIGIGLESLATVDIAEMDTMIDVNFRAVLHVLRALLPGMVERDRGHVVNLSSVGGLYPSNVGAGYGATKAAVHKMSMDIRFDLKGTRIRVTEIAPGLVRSEFFDVRFGGDKEKVERQFRHEDGDIAPATIADAILFALEAPWHVNVSLIELMPVIQVMGGVRMTPFATE